MLKILRTIKAPLLSLIILMTGAGLFSTFVPLRLTLEGYSPFIAGCVSSAYFAGLVLGSLFAQEFITRIGHIRSFAALASLVATLSMLQGIFLDPFLWCLLRFASGIFMAGLFIVIQTWLLMMSGTNNRGAVLSLYMIAFYASQSGGQFLLGIADPTSLIPFCITTMLLSLSTVPVSVTYATSPVLEESTLLSPFRLFKISKFGVSGAFGSGMIMGALTGLAPVYSYQVGMSLSEVARFMGIIIFGGFILQWPIGYLSDIIKRRTVLVGVCFITTILALLIALFSYYSKELLLFFSVFLGGFSFTIYPLSISYTNDHLDPKDLVAATGGLLLAYGFGSVVGPLIAPLFMQSLGPLGLFIFMSVISTVLGFIGLAGTPGRVSRFLRRKSSFQTIENIEPQIHQEQQPENINPIMEQKGNTLSNEEVELLNESKEHTETILHRVTPHINASIKVDDGAFDKSNLLQDETKETERV